MLIDECQVIRDFRKCQVIVDCHSKEPRRLTPSRGGFLFAKKGNHYAQEACKRSTGSDSEVFGRGKPGEHLDVSGLFEAVALPMVEAMEAGGLRIPTDFGQQSDVKSDTIPIEAGHGSDGCRTVFRPKSDSF